MKPLAPNTLLQNRYLIVHLIGKGGMGEVYLAVDQRLGSAIALKRTLHGDDPALGDAFEREARTLARLRHPALPKVSDHFIENGNQFLVMEHISGDDLAKRLKATGNPFPLSWVLFWADQLLDALAYLHSHEPPIIHRDIKPQNLKLTDDNNIVLLDFGLSKNSTGQTNITSGSGSTGSVVGYTPHYAPMEQIRGTGTNPRSDIYSLSATLYQLLTNVVPPDALSRADFLLSGKTDPIVPINEINPEIPKSISDVVLRGMSISQDQRYADAREMQRVLRETYARMQNQMAEKTVAFRATEEPSPGETSGFSSDKTEQYSAPVSAERSALQEAMGAQTIPYGMMESSPAENLPTAAQHADRTEQFQGFDATLRMGEENEDVSANKDLGVKTEVLPIDSAPKQSNIKTAVIGDDFGAAEYFEQNEVASAAQNLETGDYSAKTNENFVAPPVTGDKTVPFIEFENQPANVVPAPTQPLSAFDSAPPAESFASPPESFAPVETQFVDNQFGQPGGQTFPTPETNYDSQPKPAPPVVQPKPERKTSNGVLLGILGALFGLVVLAAAGGGIAWYLMNPSGTTDVPATPTPVVSVTPTPEPTPEQAITNTDNTNSDVVTTSSPDNTEVNTTPVPEPTRSVVTQQPTQVPTKTVTTRPTQVTTKTQRPVTPRTPTPKPQPTTKIRGKIIPQ